MEGPLLSTTFPTEGADLSFVTVFLRALPLEMSERRAPYTSQYLLHRRDKKSLLFQHHHHRAASWGRQPEAGAGAEAAEAA